jgi:hypothetical protein
MSSRPPTHSSEEPRSEPEIIPPLREEVRGDTMWSSVDNRGTHRIYVARLGPLSIAVMLLGIALLAAVLLVLLIGTFLIWIPVVALLMGTAVISEWWRGRTQ